MERNANGLRTKPTRYGDALSLDKAGFRRPFRRGPVAANACALIRFNQTQFDGCQAETVSH